MPYIIYQTLRFLFISAGSALVITLKGFTSVLMYTVPHLSHATTSLKKLYAIELLLFFKVESGIVVLQRTNWLSTYTDTGLLIGIPIIFNLYPRSRRYSQQIFIATNYLPNELVLTDVCFFDSQYIGALFMNTSFSDQDCLVNLSPSWLAST